MGAVNFTIDGSLVEFLVKRLPIDTFIETGTYRGDAIELVKPYFSKFFSIESSEEYYIHAAARFQNDPSVTIIKGDSGVVLVDLVKRIGEKSILFWLDAHWCADENTTGEMSKCPLLRELSSIGHLSEQSVILIDDARLFLCPPGKPHDYSQWPDLNEVLAALDKLSDRHKLMIINDIMIYYPENLNNDLQHFAHERGVDWLKVMVKSREHDVLLEEVNSKEKEIENLWLIAEERLQVIQGQKRTTEKIRPGFESRLEPAKALVEERGRNREKEIKDLRPIAELRLRIIEEQERTIRALRRWRIKERLKFWLSPRLGVLWQYPPRAFRIPAWYSKTQSLRSFPVISIVTPCLNQVDFLERTIKSLLEQNYPKLEYIVQDGGSDDGAVEILEKYNDSVSHWESKDDKGQANAINLGFRHATGEIMAYLNSDDLLLPGALHYVAQYFSEHSDVDVVYGHRVLIDENDREIGRWTLPHHNDDVLSWADYIPQETLFWRRRIWERAGGYIDESFRFAMDWELILRFRDEGAKFVRLPRFLGAFRVHPHQKTSAEIDELGNQEMGRLRERCHGREVSDLEIYRNTRMYLRQHVLLNKLYRLNILRY